MFFKPNKYHHIKKNFHNPDKLPLNINKNIKIKVPLNHIALIKSWILGPSCESNIHVENFVDIFLLK